MSLQAFHTCMGAHIHMIGTVHDDAFGPSRLERALNKEKPDIICLESSTELEEYIVHRGGKEFYKKKIRFYSKRGLNHEIAQLFEEYANKIYGYETEVPSRYVREHDIPVYLIDDPNEVEVHRRMDTLPPRGNIREMNKYTKLSNIIRANVVYSDFLTLFSYGNIPHDAEQKIVDSNVELLKSGERDRIPAQKLMNLATDKKIIHITGLVHCLNDLHRRTVYSMIKDKPNVKITRTTLGYY